MNSVSNSSVHLIITSPPYWQLKDYGSVSQIGYHDSYEEYINNLNLVWNECHRVLHPGCRLCVIIGDQFARSVYYGRYKVIPIRTEIIKFCESAGFDYMGAIIWQKVTTTNTTGGASVMGSYPYPRNGILKLDYEFILIFKKHGKAPAVSKDIKEESKLTHEEWNEYFSGHWNFSGVRQEGHLAMFPEELPYRLIKMFSFVGDTVLDPFLGSGTTSLSAIKLSRNSIGYEINKDFFPVIREKLGADKIDMYGSRFEFIEEQLLRNPSDKIDSLPYVFKDNLKLDKKTDPKKMKFGSRIDSENDYNRDEFYLVKDILSANSIILDGGLKINLLGIRINDENNGGAIHYLTEKVKGQKVFIRFDGNKYDCKGNLHGYIYLKNRTFVNAHLLKRNLADVDEDADFAMKDKFLKIRETANG